MDEVVDYIDPMSLDDGAVAVLELKILSGMAPPDYEPGSHCPVSFDNLEKGDSDA